MSSSGWAVARSSSPTSRDQGADGVASGLIAVTFAVLSLSPPLVYGAHTVHG
jgi:hypothetical protein